MKEHKYIKNLILLIVIAILVITCWHQYCTIEKGKVTLLNSVLFYTQNMIEESFENDFENWESEVSIIFVMQDCLPNTEKGDYKKVRDLISNVSKIENPKKKESLELLEEARDIRISKTTELGKWSVKIIKSDS